MKWWIIADAVRPRNGADAVMPGCNLFVQVFECIMLTSFLCTPLSPPGHRGKLYSCPMVRLTAMAYYPAPLPDRDCQTAHDYIVCISYYPFSCFLLFFSAILVPPFLYPCLFPDTQPTPS